LADDLVGLEIRDLGRGQPQFGLYLMIVLCKQRREPTHGCPGTARRHERQRAVSGARVQRMVDLLEEPAEHQLWQPWPTRKHIRSQLPN
jgi:hypothetical protein